MPCIDLRIPLEGGRSRDDTRPMKQFRVGKDNNPVLIREILRRRGYVDVDDHDAVDVRQDHAAGAINQPAKDDEIDVAAPVVDAAPGAATSAPLSTRPRKDCSISAAAATPHVQWGQNAFSIDYTPLRDQAMTTEDGAVFLANQIPGLDIGTKEGMLGAVRGHCTRAATGRFPAWFLPTYAVADVVKAGWQVEQVEKCRQEAQHDDDIWIYKSQVHNRGYGIEIFPSLDQARSALRKRTKCTRSTPSTKPRGILQRYCPNPMLLEKRKFDVRVFFLVARVKPTVLCYAATDFGKWSYVKRCLPEFDLEKLQEQARHVTNQRLQMKQWAESLAAPGDTDDVEVGEREVESATAKILHDHERQIKDALICDLDTALEMQDGEQEKSHNSSAGARGLAKEHVTSKLRTALRDLGTIVREELERSKRPAPFGCFQLFGCDFLIAEGASEVYLLEANRNPALHTGCNVLRKLVPPLVAEAFRIVEEAHSPSFAGRAAKEGRGPPSEIFEQVDAL